MGSDTQRIYDLGFNLRYHDKNLISVTIDDFTGYFTHSMPLAFRIKKDMMILHDRFFGDLILRHIEILRTGRSSVSYVYEKDEFMVLWKKYLNKSIIKAASKIAKFKMNLIQQEEVEDVGIRVRRKQG